MIRFLCFTAALGLSLSVASAEQFWITYEGDDFPENQGWTRIWHQPGAQRWIDHGKLVIESRPHIAIDDFYEMYFDSSFVPGPGEKFVMQWGLNVVALQGFVDPGICVVSGDLFSVGFVFQTNRLYSIHEPSTTAAFQPGKLHQFELRSEDMRRYELYIDDVLSLNGVFYDVFGPPRMAWGDLVEGAASLAQWDYVAFGIVPELGIVPGLLAVAAVVLRRTR